MTNPWEALRERVDLLLVRAPIAGRGRYYHERRCIVIDSRLGLAEQRAVLHHELVHAERGDTPCCTPELEARQEASCEQEAARRAISLECLADAMLWARCPAEAADELRVDEALLGVRLLHLHPSERAYIMRRLAAREDAA